MRQFFSVLTTTTLAAAFAAAASAAIGCSRPTSDDGASRSKDTVADRADCLAPIPATATVDTAVGATYRSSRGDTAGADGNPWRYWRTTDRVAYEYLAQNIVEMWRRNGSELFFERWFPEHKKAITYTGGELRALGRTPTWARVSRVLPDEVRTQLKAAGTTQYRCLPATRYSGTVNGVEYRVLWLSALDLPAEVIAQRGEHTSRLYLEALHDEAAVTVALAAGRGFEAIDYSDVGDREGDPFIATLIRQGFVEHPTDHNGAHGDTHNSAHAH